MNDTSWFSFRPTECATLTFKPKSRSQKAAIIGVILLLLTVPALLLVQRQSDSSLSKNYIFTYLAIIPEFYLPGCLDEGTAGVIRQRGRQERMSLEKKLKKLPPEQVQAFCDRLHWQIVSTCKPVDDHRADTLRRMLEKMKPFLSPVGKKSSVNLIACPSPHAFSLPDGRIYFTIPLFEMLQSNEARAFVLAHELGHIENKHGFKNLANTDYFRNGSSKEFKQFFSETHLQANEMEADLAACFLAHKAGFDPGAAVGFLEKNFQGKILDTTLLFRHLGLRHSFHEKRYDCLYTYLEIAWREYLSQWQIINYQRHMTYGGLMWQQHKGKFSWAGALLAAVFVLVRLRRRKEIMEWNAAVPICLLLFLALGGIFYWMTLDKITSGNACNCAGKIKDVKAVLRESPDASSHALALIDEGEQIWITSLSERKIFDGRKVLWRRVKWGNTPGWVLDGLVERQGEGD